MMMEQYELPIERFAHGTLLSVMRDLPGNPMNNVEFKTSVKWCAESQAFALVSTFRTPVQIMQQDKIVVRYPDGLWQYIKSKLRLRYRERVVRMTELLRYPDLPVPNPIADRLHVHARPSLGAAWSDES